MKNINDQIFIKKMNIPKDITTESVSNPLYWNSINNTSNTSKENDYYLNEPTYFDVSTKPIVPPNSSYFDTSESNPELPEKKSTYLNVSSQSSISMNLSYFDTSESNPELPEKKSTYVNSFK